MKKEELQNIINELRVNKELESYSLAYLIDLPRETELFNMNKITSRNDIYVFMYNDSPRPLEVGSLFEVLIPLENPLKYIETPVFLRYFSMNKKIEIDKLYEGISVIGLFEFSHGIPSIIYKMKEYMSKDFNHTETFFLASKDLLIRILDIYEKRLKANSN